MKNKILLLVSSMNLGGAQRVASTLANAWVSRGDQVILMPTFSGHGECFYQLISAVRLVYLADLVSSRVRTWNNRFVRLRALRRFIATERPNVVISFLPNVNVAAIIASVGLGIPLVVCEHTDPFVKSHNRPLLWRVACWFIYPFADTLVVLTKSVAMKYRSFGRVLRRIRVIPNPISKEVLNIQHSGCSTTVQRLLSVGRLVESKQMDVLIHVFASLAKRHHNWVLRIAGDGPLKTVLQQQIIGLGLKGRVELLGQIADIGKELVDTDIFVSTSRHEGFPMGLLEAMAVGLPCVTFDCPSGPREISLDGQVALLVPLNDEQAFRLALERLMLDTDLRDNLGSRARASVIDRFSLDKVLQYWDILFKEVINK